MKEQQPLAPRSTPSRHACRSQRSALILSALSMMIAAAHAQTAPAEKPADKPADKAAAMTEQTIVITAQKRPQKVQTIPGSVTAITGKTLEETGVTDLTKLDQVAPGVTVTANTPGASTISIRGITDLSGGLNYTSSTGLYLDEIPMSAIAGVVPDIAFWDAERVEVLRGPQGTLFGEGSMGGTVRIISIKPDAGELSGRVKLGYHSVAGGDGGHLGRATLNVPIIKDQLALRANVVSDRYPGWIDVPALGAANANEGKSTSGRIALRWTPTKALTLDAMVAHQKIDGTFYNSATSPGVFEPRDQQPASGAPQFLGAAKHKSDITNVTMNYDLGPVTLVASSSRFTQDITRDQDISPLFSLLLGTPVVASLDQPVMLRVNSSEVRLVSNGENMLNWTVGAWINKRVFDTSQDLSINFPGGFGPFPPGYTSRDLNVQRGETKARALFADVEYKLTSTIAAQFGVRSYREDTSNFITVIEASPVSGLTVGPLSNGSGSASATSPKFGLSWKAANDLLVYVRAAQGFRGGSDNYALPQYPEIPAKIKPENIKSVEVGVKAQPANWLTVNAAVFQNNWTDYQLPLTTTDGLIRYTGNAGAASAKGADIEIVARPIGGLRLGFNLSALNATIDQTVVNAVGQVVAQAGNRIPRAPRTQWSVSALYDFALSETLGASVSANYSERGKTFSEAANYSVLENSAFKNLYLSFGINRGNWSGSLWVANALNSKATNQKASLVGLDQLPISSAYERPRTIGIEASYTF